MKHLLFILSISGLLTLCGVANAQVSDSVAIRNTALDYVDGFYTADPERMERALHPMLTKVAYVPGPDGKPTFRPMSALLLVQSTRQASNYLKGVDRKTLKRDVVILDIGKDVASVKASMHEWIDYMHMVKVNGQWKIINVLWELSK